MTVVDAGGNELVGTAEDGLTWTSNGRFGSCYDYDESDDSVYCGNSSKFVTPDGYTIEAWINLNNVIGNKVIISRATDGTHRDWYFGLAGDEIQTTGGGFGFNQFTVDENLVADTWYYVAWTYDEAVSIIYINGINESESIETDAIDEGALDVYMGQLYSSDTNPMGGRIDEVRISSRALSGEEIKNNYYRNVENY